MIVNIRRFALQCIVCGELLIFGYTCFYGRHGIQNLHLLAEQKQKMEEKIVHQEQAIAKIATEITDWQENPFLYERIAREQLHMARSHEILYHVPSNTEGNS